MWRFSEKPRHLVSRDPFEDEFFAPVEGHADALVREVVQNSLDAAIDQPIRVRFRLSFPGEEIESQEAAHYLVGLRDHLLASGNEVLRNSVPAMPFLVIEDFGTGGLCGDPARHRDVPPNNGERDDFYRFWRNIGRSSKSDQDRGRWGLGKTVFQATSRIQAMFGLTVRADDGRALLMGQAVTRVHEVDGKAWFPEGFWAEFDPEGFQLPIEELQRVQSFSRHFRLGRRSQPGLSVVVPYPLLDVTAPELARAAITNYFVAILRGQLSVEVMGDGFSECIDAESLERVAGDLDFGSASRESRVLRPPFELARFALRSEQTNIHVCVPPTEAAPQWTREMFLPGCLAELRQRFQSGGRFGMRVPLTVRKRTPRQIVNSWFDLYVERVDIGRGEDWFVREGMTIPEVRRVPSRKGVRGLLIIDEKTLSGLLGDAEGPAHATWSEREKRPDRTYETWSSRIRFVRNSLSNLLALFDELEQEIDRELLVDVFAVPESLRGLGRREGGKTRPFDEDLPPSRPKRFTINRIDGGFSIHGVPDQLSPGMRMAVRTAYDVPDGDPFRRYEVFDFNLADPTFVRSSHGVELVRCAENEIEIAIQDPAFEVSVTGFDIHRDLCVRAVIDEAQS